MLDMTREWEEKWFGVGPIGSANHARERVSFSFLDLSFPQMSSEGRPHRLQNSVRCQDALGIRPSGSLTVEGLGAGY